MADEKSKTSFWDELRKLFTDLLTAFLIFLLLIFIAGELYAIYLMQIGNVLLLWLPVFVLMAVLFWKAIE